MNHSIANTPKTKFQPLSGAKFKHFLGGVTGGVASSLILHPLDLMKIRFAVSDVSSSTKAKSPGRPHYTGLRHAMSHVYNHEGFRGLYKGVIPNIIGSGCAWGSYFFCYNSIKSWHQGGDEKLHLGPWIHMLAAAEAGIFSLVITNPIWVVKTRLCLQVETVTTLTTGKFLYRGMMDALLKIYKYEGVQGLYKGFVPGMWGVSHGAVQFTAYEEMKAQYNRWRLMPTETKLSSAEYLMFAAISKIIAAVTTFPYQVVRARMQDQHSHYINTRHCIMETYKYEGLAAFYRGLTPYLVHVMPNICVVFILYETIVGERKS